MQNTHSPPQCQSSQRFGSRPSEASEDTPIYRQVFLKIFIFELITDNFIRCAIVDTKRAVGEYYYAGDLQNITISDYYLSLSQIYFKGSNF